MSEYLNWLNNLEAKSIDELIERMDLIDANSFEEKISEASHYTYLDDQNEKLKTENEKLREGLRFYAKENNWLGITDKIPFDVLKWIRIVEDDMDENSLGGKLARAILKEVGE